MFWKCGFRFWEKWLIMSKNWIWFQVFKFLCFYFLHFFFKVTLWTNIAILPEIWDHIFKTVFPKLFFVCFLFKAQNCLEICVNCAGKCVMPLFTTLRSNFQQKKIQKRTPVSSEMLDLLRRDIWTVSMRRISEGP